MNDLPNSSSIFKFILFADVGTLSTSFAKENDLEFILTLNHIYKLNNVDNWLTLNRICINADNTKYIIFSYRKQLHLTNIKIGFATIEETNNIKFLGIIFDKHLTFKHHVDVIARKISKSVGILFKLSKYLPLEIIKTLYYSLINPFLLYEIEVWHGTYANITNKIFILQKKACRAIIIYLSILTQANTLKIQNFKN